MMRIFLVGLSALVLLSGCTPSSLMTVDIDLLLVVPSAAHEGSFPASGGELLLPDADGVDSNDLELIAPVRHDAERLEATMAGILSLETGGSSATVTLALQVSGDIVDETHVTLTPGSSVQVVLPVAVSADENPQALEQIRTGNVNIRLRLSSLTGSASTANINYELELLSLSVSAKPIF